MQFLETVAEKLNKVDQLAAEVAVVSAKDNPGENKREDEDELELNPEAIETADAIERLASRLGDWGGAQPRQRKEYYHDDGEEVGAPGGGGTGEGDEIAPRPLLLVDGESPPWSDPAASSLDPTNPAVAARLRLNAVLSELRRQETETSEAVQRHEEVVREAVEEREMREREAAGAEEELRSLQLALESERVAHDTTRSQAADREAALTSDATEYDGMVAAVRRQASEKEKEAEQLETRAVEATEEEEPRLLREAEAAEEEAAAAAAAAAKEEEEEGAGPAASAGAGEDGGGERDGAKEYGDDGGARHGGGNNASSAAVVAASSSLERLSQLRTALAEAEEEEATLRREETSRELEVARYPSQAERVRELERRLVSLDSQLAAKRAQVQSLVSDKSGLETRLEEALRERRRLQQRRVAEGAVASAAGRGGGGGGGGMGRGSAGTGGARKRRGAGVVSAGDGVDGSDDGKAGGRGGVGGGITGYGVRSRVKHAAETVDSLSVRAGRHLRRSGGTRSIVIVYILALHTIAFVILAVRAMLHAP